MSVMRGTVIDSNEVAINRSAVCDYRTGRASVHTYYSVASVVTGERIWFDSLDALVTYLIVRHFFATARGITLTGDAGEIVSREVDTVLAELYLTEDRIVK